MSDVQEIILTDEQAEARDKLRAWLEAYPNVPRPFFVVEGFAGTGKSFTIKQIVKELGLDPLYMTYTGKAALVLRKYGGVPAQTIHSTIYRVEKVSDNVFRQLYKERDEAADEKVKVELNERIKKLLQPQFSLRDGEEDEVPGDVFILDECSMVDQSMLSDILSFGKPVIALGDPGQLPPVKGTGALFNEPAEARLTKILRQAEGNPIIKWSMMARQQRPLPTTDPDGLFTDPISKIPHFMVSQKDQERLMEEHDIVLCWKNATVKRLNAWRRRSLGLTQRDPIYPTIGDRLVFRKNDREHGVFNGLFCEVTDVGDFYDAYIELEVQLETEEKPKKLNFLRAPFEYHDEDDPLSRVKPWEFKGNQQADFGYAITCHRAQGSQWPKVLVFEEDVFNWNKGDARQKRAEWLYTAITRAAEKCTILAGKVG